MEKQVVEWEYNRRPGTELYDGHLEALTPELKAKYQQGMIDEFFGVNMHWMLEALHEFLCREPEVLVQVARRQPASGFHRERVAYTPLPQELVDMIRERPGEAYKHFEPIAVRSEE